MRIRVVLFLILLGAGSLTLSLTRGQERPAPSPAASRPSTPAPGAGPAPARTAAPRTQARAAPLRNLTNLSPLQKQMLLAAQRGADWLYRMNGDKGRFLHGYLPALKVALDGDHYLHQAGAALALARAASFTGEERYAVRATQALLALLEETAPDAKDPAVRATTLPGGIVNPLGAAGLLVLAIHALPNPQADLLDKAEQLCNYIRRQARANGSLGGEAEARPNEEGCGHAATALHALAKSQKRRPAAWKTGVIRKGLAHYGTWWRGHKCLGPVPALTAAATEAYLLTGERAGADLVSEMNDWVCTLQYAQIDARRLLWYGGFMNYADGRPVETAPQVTCATHAEGLADASRVARKLGDATRHTTYTEALERCLQFLCTLQYTEANTQHFADWYRPRLVGAFHASHQDGDLRLDYTEHAVSALCLYLEHVVR
jgi:hypothetical protein